MWSRDVPGEGTACTLAQRSEAAQESVPCNQSLWLESDEMVWEERPDLGISDGELAGVADVY